MRTLNDIISVIKTSENIKFIPVEVSGIPSIVIAEVKQDVQGMTIEPLTILMNDDLFAIVNPAPTMGDQKFTVEGYTKQ